MASTPAYASTPIVDQSSGNTANTNVDGTGTLLTVATGTAAGKRISRVKVSIAVFGASTASVVNFFYSPDGGTTKRLIASVLCPAVTATASVAPGQYFAPDLVGLELVTTNAILYAATTIGQVTNVHCESAGL